MRAQDPRGVIAKRGSTPGSPPPSGDPPPGRELLAALLEFDHDFFSFSGVTSISGARSRVHSSSVIGLSLITYLPSVCSCCQASRQCAGSRGRHLGVSWSKKGPTPGSPRRPSYPLEQPQLALLGADRARPHAWPCRQLDVHPAGATARRASARSLGQNPRGESRA